MSRSAVNAKESHKRRLLIVLYIKNSSLPFTAAQCIFSLRSMKMTFHCKVGEMDLHLGLTLKIWPV